MTTWMWIWVVLFGSGLIISSRDNLSARGRGLNTIIMMVSIAGFLWEFGSEYPMIAAPISALAIPPACITLAFGLIAMLSGETFGDGLPDGIKWLVRPIDPITGGPDKKKNNRFSMCVLLPATIVMLVWANHVPTPQHEMKDVIDRPIAEYMSNPENQSSMEWLKHGNDNKGTFDPEIGAAEAQAQVEMMDAEAEIGTWWVWTEFWAFLLIFLISVPLSWTDELGGWSLALFGRATGIFKTVAEGVATAATLRGAGDAASKVVGAVKK